MSPEKYNRIQEAAGEFSEEHKKLLVEFFQSCHPELSDDGLFGPLTRDALEKHFGICDESKLKPSFLAETIVEVATAELGRGEEHRDNAGEDVHRYRDFPYGDDFTRTIGNWCAQFVGYCIEQACSRMDVDMPFQRRFYDKARNRYMPIGGARALTHRVCEAGEYIVRDGYWLSNNLLPGDVFSTKRGTGNQGHVGIILKQLDYHKALTLEGNTLGRKSPFQPAKVRKRTRSFDKMALVHIGRL